ncbi:hypothetical protein QVA66_08805 [Staphylococcus chromogenes]|nr:hypothetical protein [Staphylococcus chromogenes]
MVCSDSYPGAFLMLGPEAKAAWINDLTRLANSSLGRGVNWVKLDEKGGLYLSTKKDSPDAEQHWKEKWKHGQVTVFRP